MHWSDQVNLFTLDLEPKSDDSNEVTVAKALLWIFREINGVSDEMSSNELDRVNYLFEGPVQAAFEVLRARDLL